MLLAKRSRPLIGQENTLLTAFWSEIQWAPENHPISAKDQASSLEYVWYAGGIGKEDIFVADVEELENLDASEIHARRLDAKEVLMLKSGDKLQIPCRRWNSQDGRKRLGTPNQLNARRSCTRRGDVLQGESDGSQPSDHQADDTKARHDLWSISGNHLYRFHVQRSIRRVIPKNNSSTWMLSSGRIGQMM